MKNVELELIEKDRYVGDLEEQMMYITKKENSYKYEISQLSYKL